MATLLLLNVQYAVGKTRTELINLDQVVRIIEPASGKGSLLYFGVSGPEISVVETISEIQEQLSALR
jgi:hypothetical protein